MKPWQLFIASSTIGILLTFAVRHLFFADALLQPTYGGQLALESIIL